MNYLKRLLDRALHGWSWVRAIYVLIGVAVIINAAPHGEWIGISLGAYLVIMGVFAIGCVGGRCAIPAASQDKAEQSS